MKHGWTAMRWAAVLLSLAGGCTTEILPDAPNPVVAIALRDRCQGINADLAIIDIVGAPRPFREVPPGFPADEAWVGIDVTINVQRVLPASLLFPGVGSPPPLGMFQLHLFTDIDRSTRSGNFQAYDTSAIVLGRTLLVAFPRFRSTFAEWSIQIIRTDARVTQLAEAWYQFPIGTPVVQVLDPSEWNNPLRACTMAH